MGIPERLRSALVISEQHLAELQEWAQIASKDDKEDEYLRIQLTNQLAQMVAKILDDSLDTALADIKPTTYGADLRPWQAPLREDEVKPWPDVDTLLQSAPHLQDRYFVVPVRGTRAP